MTTTHLWFAGTPEFAAYSLNALIESGLYHIDGVLTQPDRPAGRGRKLTASAVKNVALAHDIPIAQPEKLRQDTPPFSELPRPDLVIVAAYGLLLPQWFLEYPRLGCLNIHASLLPRWRGAAPIQRAIEAGDLETGIGIMQMDKGLDTGAVWLEKRTPITNSTTSPILHDTLMHLGAEVLLEALPIVLSEQHRPTPQAEDGVTYAHKLSKAEAQIDWSESGETIARKIRAFAGFPVAHTQLNGETIRIHHAEHLEATHNATLGEILQHDKYGLTVGVKDGKLRITTLQLPNKPIISAAELKNSRNLIGQHFS